MQKEYTLSDLLDMPTIQYFCMLVANRVYDEEFSEERVTPLVSKFKELISTNNFKIEPTEHYAESMNVSVAALNDICLEFAGFSAKQLLLNLKINEAKWLLTYSDLNINEISLRLGFEDSSYFARIFKKKTRLSPTQFQEQYRILL